jgi:hypothetical protein
MNLPTFGLSVVEWVIVGSIAVLLFGYRLPGISRALSKSMIAFATCPYCGKQSLHFSHCSHCGRPRRPPP